MEILGRLTLYPQAVGVLDLEGGVQNPKYDLQQRAGERFFCVKLFQTQDA